MVSSTHEPQRQESPPGKRHSCWAPLLGYQETGVLGEDKNSQERTLVPFCPLCGSCSPYTTCAHSLRTHNSLKPLSSLSIGKHQGMKTESPVQGSTIITMTNSILFRDCDMPKCCSKHFDSNQLISLHHALQNLESKGKVLAWIQVGSTVAQDPCICGLNDELACKGTWWRSLWSAEIVSAPFQYSQCFMTAWSQGWLMQTSENTKDWSVFGP